MRPHVGHSRVFEPFTNRYQSPTSRPPIEPIRDNERVTRYFVGLFVQKQQRVLARMIKPTLQLKVYCRVSPTVARHDHLVAPPKQVGESEVEIAIDASLVRNGLVYAGQE